MNKTQDILLHTVCPVCNSINSDEAKYCLNSKCGFIVKHDEYFVDIPESLFNEYSKKLKKAKQNYKKIITLKESTKQIEQVIGSVNSTKIEEKYNMNDLSNLKKDQFESIADFQKRIEGLEFIQIGSYKLKKYNADKGHYIIEIKIEKQANQTLDYDFTKLKFIKIKKEEAKKFHSMGDEFPLFAKLRLGIKAQSLDKIHTVNQSLHGMLNPIVDKFNFDENSYKIKTLKFGGSNVEIQENELIRMIKEHKKGIGVILVIAFGCIGL